jgi:hypothetical protein
MLNVKFMLFDAKLCAFNDSNSSISYDGIILKRYLVQASADSVVTSATIIIEQ